jgi:hypothetical protein
MNIDEEAGNKRFEYLVEAIVKTMRESSGLLPDARQECIIALSALANISATMLFAIQSMGGDSDFAKGFFLDDLESALKKLSTLPEHIVQNMMTDKDIPD